MSQKKYPFLTGNLNETIRYYYSRSEQLNLSIFNLDSHTLHLKIVHQRPEIQACKVKIYSAPATRGFVKGPSPDLISQAYCKRIRTLTFSFSLEKNHILKCFNCSTNNLPLRNQSVHCIPSQVTTLSFGSLTHTRSFGSCKKTQKTRHRV